MAGEIVGSCCGIRLSPLHANVGMYVVRSDCRGGGLGKQLWNAAIEHVGPRNKVSTRLFIVDDTA